MEKFERYRIDLKGMQTDSGQFDFHLDDAFFTGLEGSDVQKGEVDVSLLIKKTSQAFDLIFHTEGIVSVTCDRCLGEMEQPVVSDDILHVRFGPAYAEEADDRVVIPEEEGVINVAWFMYEFIALAIPMKHLHASGECDELMQNQLNKYLRISSEDDAEGGDAIADMSECADDVERPIDPRWNELKKLLDNIK